MGRSFRALEQSLGKNQSCSAKSKQVNSSALTGGADGMPASALAPSQLQEQIDVIHGRRVAKPTRSLRMLENRIMGHTSTAQVRRETLRLDHGQVALPPSSQEQTTMFPVAPTHKADIQWRSQPLNAFPPVSAAAYPYAPEFSAPDTGRFQVESFANGPATTGDQFLPGTAVNMTPATDSIDESVGWLTRAQSEQSAKFPALGTGSAQVESFAGAPAIPVVQLHQESAASAAPVTDYIDESAGWLTQAQSEQPEKITAASKKSLDPSLTLAKDDFERELAAILGQSATPAAPEQDALFNVTPSAAPAPANQAQSAMPNPNAPPPHPSHDVFDQMGLAMRYANSFDLGNINLNDRFNRFESELEQSTKAPDHVVAATVSNPFVDPMNLDEFDLVAELAVISSECPAQPPTTHNNQQNFTDKTAGEEHDQPIS
jgi:hypothetical protein